jgi:hypothetical protein
MSDNVRSVVTVLRVSQAARGHFYPKHGAHTYPRCFSFRSDLA